MNTEEKAKAYDEALNWMREIYPGLHGATKEDAEHFFPELAESDDERIIRLLRELGSFDVVKELYEEFNLSYTDVLYWLEKQKENIEKEYVFRPLAGTDITIAAEQAIKRANEGDRLVLAFNGAYIPVRKDCSVNKIVDIYDAFIEKQKEQKPVPVKPDDMLMLERIMQLVEFCNDKEIIWNWLCEKVKEQKPAENHTLEFEKAKAKYEGIVEGKQTVLDNPEDYGLYKPAEWDEEDIKRIRSEEYTKGFNDAAFGGKLKKWNVEDEDRIRQIERIAQEAGCTQKLQEEIHDWLKSLRPQYHGDVTMTEAYKMGLEAGKASSWKPSDEQKEALEYVIRDYREDGCNATANYLQEILDHLKNM